MKAAHKDMLFVLRAYIKTLSAATSPSCPASSRWPGFNNQSGKIIPRRR
jgi:hypothetical protein